MSTVAQAEASRINGARSRGPATPEGKERSRWNALRHGLAAEKVVVLAEEAQEFAEYRQAFLDDLRPAGALEGALVERIALLHWRLRRAAEMEAAILSDDQWLAHMKECEWDNCEPGHPTRDWKPPRYTAVGRALKESMTGPNCPYDTVGRYERRLEHGLFQAIREWRELRRERGEGRRETEDAERQERERGTGNGEQEPAAFSREPQASAGQRREDPLPGEASAESVRSAAVRRPLDEPSAPAVPPAEVIAEKLLADDPGAPVAPGSTGQTPVVPRGV